MTQETRYKTLHLKVSQQTVEAMVEHQKQLGLPYLWQVLEHYALSHSPPNTSGPF